MNDLGFFCINRKIFEHEIWRDPEKVRAWIEIVGYFARGTDNCVLKRGQFKASYAEMARRWGWTIAKVRRFLEYLEAESMIEVVSAGSNQHHSTVYHVANYEKYNGVTKRQSPTKTHIGTVTGTVTGTVKPKQHLPFTENTGTVTGTVTGTAEFAIKEETKKNNVKQEYREREPTARSDSKNESSSHPVILLPLNNGDFEIQESSLAEWVTLYPAVDVMQELRGMRGWLISNPTRRKTKRGILRFCNAWLSKKQDKPNNGAQADGIRPYGFETKAEAIARKTREASQRVLASLAEQTFGGISTGIESGDSKHLFAKPD